MSDALGMLETVGLTGIVEGGDAMSKAAGGKRSAHWGWWRRAGPRE